MRVVDGNHAMQEDEELQEVEHTDKIEFVFNRTNKMGFDYAYRLNISGEIKTVYSNKPIDVSDIVYIDVFKTKLFYKIYKRDVEMLYGTEYKE